MEDKSLIETLLEEWKELMGEYEQVYETYMDTREELLKDQDGLYLDEREYLTTYDLYVASEEYLIELLEDLEAIEHVIEYYGGTVPSLEDFEEEEAVITNEMVYDWAYDYIQETFGDSGDECKCTNCKCKR